MTKLALRRAGSRAQEHAARPGDDYFGSILAPPARLTIVRARSRNGSACGKQQAKDVRAP